MKSILSWALCGFLMSSVLGSQVMADGEKSKDTALGFEMKSLDGKTVDLSDYEGKVIVAVNVASRCGYTRQYADLQKLYETYKDKGLVVLGFPCNQFGKQEPGSSKEIAEFCSKEFGVTFDMFEKIEVKGEGACSLYKHLTAADAKPAGKGDISWNFEKFLIDREGNVAGRFKSSANPTGKEFTAAVEALIAKK